MESIRRHQSQRVRFARTTSLRHPKRPQDEHRWARVREGVSVHAVYTVQDTRGCVVDAHREILHQSVAEIVVAIVEVSGEVMHCGSHLIE
jgi:hypothetical protein